MCLPNEGRKTDHRAHHLHEIETQVNTARKRSLRRLCFYTCLSVILFTGGLSASVYAGIHPPGKQTPPWEADTPGKFVKVMFLLLSVSHSVHWGCLPRCMLGYTPLGSRHPPQEQTPPGSRHPVEADTPLRSACWEIRPTSNRTILLECILVHINFGSLFGRCRILAFNTPAENIKHVK